MTGYLDAIYLVISDYLQVISAHLILTHLYTFGRDQSCFRTAEVHLQPAFEETWFHQLVFLSTLIIIFQIHLQWL